MPYISIFEIAWSLISSPVINWLRQWRRRLCNLPRPPPYLHHLAVIYVPTKRRHSKTFYRIRRLAQRISSHSYNIQGILFLWRHKTKLYQSTLKPVVWTWIYSGILVGFGFVLLPMLLVPILLLAWFQWELLWIVQSLLELVLMGPVVLFVPGIHEQLFETVLKMRGHQALLQRAATSTNSRKKRKFSSSSFLIGLLHFGMCWATRGLRHSGGFLGNVAWFYINGRLYAWNYHWHYHYRIRKRQKLSTQYRFIQQHGPDYHWFGMVALWLDRIPLLNLLFVLTNTIAAALWAADLEDQFLEQPSETTALVGTTKTRYVRTHDCANTSTEPPLLATAIPIQLEESPTAPHYDPRR